MATASGSDCICCMDRRSYHGLVIAFTTFSHYPSPPAIYTGFVKSSIISDVIYEQFFCDFAVTQLKDLYFTMGSREIKYYIHCHCSNVGSLQCKAARAFLIDSLKRSKLQVFTSNFMQCPKICCNSWLCIPAKFYGAIRCNFYHCYCFQISDVAESCFFPWPPSYYIKVVEIHLKLKLMFVFCKCNNSDMHCKRKCSQYFNALRMFICCKQYRHLPLEDAKLHLEYGIERENCIMPVRTSDF